MVLVSWTHHWRQDLEGSGPTESQAGGTYPSRVLLSGTVVDAHQRQIKSSYNVWNRRRQHQPHWAWDPFASHHPWWYPVYPRWYSYWPAEYFGTLDGPSKHAHH